MLLALLVSAALAVILATAILNAVLFPRLRVAAPAAFEPVGEPRASVLIPARDEAAVIGATVRALLAQAPPALEVLVLDDGSTDGTADVARAAGAGDPRLQVIAGAPLPEGWLGKNWACRQLAEAARGELLVFTDAEVHWSPGALAAVLAEHWRSGADLLTVWPTQVTETWGERLTVPLAALVVLGYLPLPLVHHTPWPFFAAANGQCLVFRRRAYEALGGHEAVRGEVLEDVMLARRTKAAGLRLRMADGAGLVRCRMYRDWPSARDGFAKNILAGYGGHPLGLWAGALFHWLVFLWPWLWLVAPALGPTTWPGWPSWPVALIAAGLAARALTAAATRQRARDAWFLPLSVLLLSAVAARALWWRHRHGGPLWKGRVASS